MQADVFAFELYDIGKSFDLNIQLAIGKYGLGESRCIDKCKIITF